MISKLSDEQGAQAGREPEGGPPGLELDAAGQPQQPELGGADGAAEPGLEQQDDQQLPPDTADSSVDQAGDLATINEEGGTKRVTTRGRGRQVDQPWVLAKESGQEGGAGRGGRARPKSLGLTKVGEYGSFVVAGRGKGRDIVTVLPPSGLVVYSAGMEQQLKLQSKQRGTLSTQAEPKQPQSSQSVAKAVEKLEAPATEKRGRGRPKGSKNKGKFLLNLHLKAVSTDLVKRYTRYQSFKLSKQ